MGSIRGVFHHWFELVQDADHLRRANPVSTHIAQFDGLSCGYDLFHALCPMRIQDGVVRQDGRKAQSTAECDDGRELAASA